MVINSQKIVFSEIYSAIVNKEKITINPQVLKKLDKIRGKIEKMVSDGIIVYGITTGFGSLKDKVIPQDKLEKLQENLIKSHAVAVGNPYPENIVKTSMLLIANYLSKGNSGVRSVVVKTLVDMINKDVVPIVPEKGSVGSSGDLAPSAHIILVLIGMGEAYYKGKRMSGPEAMKKAGIKPLTLGAKEGLALINNTSSMTANAVFALAEAYNLFNTANAASALSIEALKATHKAFDPRVHKIKYHSGQILTAKNILALIKGSTIEDKLRIQDQYSIRCIPQIHGAVYEAIKFAENIVNTEINSVTDNPLVFEKNGKITFISAGNFHGEAIGIAMDSLRLAICELANISDRRIASLLDPNHNFGLPAYLAVNPGINSGFMILQYTTASLVSENKILAHPAVVDSIPTSGNVEDLVSMGTIAARKTLEVMENIKFVLAIELITSCQAIDFRIKEGGKLGLGTSKIYKQVRGVVPFFEEDNVYYQYINRIKGLIDQHKIK